MGRRPTRIPNKGFLGLGIRDAVFARCNVDWPDDPRCARLPNSEARWLDHLYWLASVKEKRSILPAMYTPEHFAVKSGLTVEVVREYTVAMAREGLVAWTPDGCLVIYGTSKNHPKMVWRDEEPADAINPYREKKGWGVCLDTRTDDVDTRTDCPDMNPYPEKRPIAEKSREEKSREENRQQSMRLAAQCGGKDENLFDLPETTASNTDTMQLFQDRWNAMASIRGCKARKLRNWPEQRRKSFLARMKEPDWRASWPEALDRIPKSDYLNGKTKNSTWVIGPDFFLRPDSVTKILEGNYDDDRADGVYESSPDEFGFEHQDGTPVG